MCASAAESGQGAAVFRKPIIYGKAARPFPAIFNLDYPLSRAEAWLEAIKRASTHLPPAADKGLKQSGLDPALGKLAICALLFPLDVVTPEKIADKSTRVFLREPDDAGAGLAKIFSHPAILPQAMAIVYETEQAIGEAKLAWPQSIDLAMKNAQRYDEIKDLLEDLWETMDFLKYEANGEEPQDVPLPEKPGDSVPLLWRSATQTGNPEYIERMVSLCLKRGAAAKTRGEKSLWNRLGAAGLYLRGKEHMRSGQTGLAETDFSAAMSRLDKDGLHGDFYIELLLRRAELRQETNNYAGMCRDYAAACALGHCGPLASARRSGNCAADL